MFFGKKGQEVELTVDSLKEQDPVLYQQIVDIGKAEGSEEAKTAAETEKTEAVKAEQERASGILALVKNPGQLEKALGFIKDGKTVGEAAIELLKDSNKEQKKDKQTTDFEKGASQMAGQGQEEDSAYDGEDPASRWDKDENLRSSYIKAGMGRTEFMNHMNSWIKNENKVREEYGNNVDPYLAYSRNNR